MFSYWDDGMILTCKPLLSRPVALATRSAEVLAAALWVGSGLLWYRLTRRVLVIFSYWDDLVLGLWDGTDMPAPAVQAGCPGNAVCGGPCTSALGGLGSPVVQADKEGITG